MAYARFAPPEPTTCNEIDPATQFGFSNDPDPITRIQILIFPAYCTENSPLLIGGESVRIIILTICTKMLEKHLSFFEVATVILFLKIQLF